MIAIGDTFDTIAEAKKAVNRTILDIAESYKVYKSDTKRRILICKDAACKFRIRVSLCKKQELKAIITIFIPHSCSPATHYKNRNTNMMWFLQPHHRALVINNRETTPGNYKYVLIDDSSINCI